MTDLMLSPDGVHVFVVVAERPTGAKTTIIPNYVTETGYTEDIPGRSNVGDTQDRRFLAVLNLKTGKTVWADGSFAPPVVDADKAGGCSLSCRQARGYSREGGVATSAGVRPSCPTMADTSWPPPRLPTTRIDGSSRSIQTPARQT